MKKETIDYTGLQPVVKEYNPEKAYPRLKNKIWRDLEKPGPCRSLTKEEIDNEYKVAP
jgi:hypothetical protein